MEILIIEKAVKLLQMDNAEGKTDDHLGGRDMNLSSVKYCINILATQLLLFLPESLTLSANSTIGE